MASVLFRATKPISKTLPCSFHLYKGRQPVFHVPSVSHAKVVNLMAHERAFEKGLSDPTLVAILRGQISISTEIQLLRKELGSLKVEHQALAKSSLKFSAKAAAISIVITGLLGIFSAKDWEWSFLGLS